ncbi:hypothetical protein SDC9_150174 [bioreactor metagenome]|uniref:Uncharacterized protein n=1 Tax=bioreactor metagenome TaxID=1076179 RepID=A0A645EQZ9_9ZZZZ
MKLVNQPDLPPAENGEFFIAPRIDILPVQIHLSAGRHVHAADNVKQGGFAGAGGADDCGKLPLFDYKRNMVKRGNLVFALAIGFAYIFNF